MADAKEVLEEAGGFKRTAKDLFAGAAGGIAQVLLGEYFFSSSLLFVAFLNSICINCLPILTR